MVIYCFVEGCKSTSYKRKYDENHNNETFFGIPTDPNLREKWIEALFTLNKQESAHKIFKLSKICKLHFSDDCFREFGSGRIRLKPNSIPSKFPRMQNDSLDKLTAHDDLHEKIVNVSMKTNMDDSRTNKLVEKVDSLDSTVQLVKEIERIDSKEIPITPKRTFMDCLETENMELDVQYNTPECTEICKTPTKKIRYPGDVKENTINDMTPRTARKSIKLLKQACTKKDITIKRLRKKQHYGKQKIESLQKLLADLKQKNLLSSNSSDIIQAVSEENTIVAEIEKGKVKGSYSPQLRAFALTVNFYSPKAYNYIRQVFKNKLPASSTIRSWYSNTSGAPGFTQEAIDILKRKSEAAGDKKLYACLTMDEMAIRKQIQYDYAEKRFVGYIDYGLIIEEPENLPVAKEALIYLLTGINERWKIPVAYFLVAGLTADERADITRKVIDFVTASGVHIIALTFDGLPANVSMCKALNADVFNDKAFFTHPSGDYNIFIFLDAAHMLKLTRNAFASKRILYDDQGRIIDFKYIENLVKLQESGGFHLRNKLNKKHIKWYKNKMNVKLAAQTLSESCAAALEQLQEDGHPDFVDCGATAKFCRMANNVFDSLNSRSLFSNGFKRPLMERTAFHFFELFDQATHYFSTIRLKMDGTLIIDSKVKTGFIGFIINMKNLKLMYQSYVQTGYLKYILTYKLSQDHIEIFFSCIRAMGGFNNNPNCIQLAAAYKRLLHHNEIKSSAEANCIPIDSTSILTVSSAKSLSASIISDKHNEDKYDDDINSSIILNDLPLSIIDKSLNHAVLYISGFVEKKILQKLKCFTCYNLLNACEEASSTFIKRVSFGYLRHPRADLYAITSTTEKVFNMYKLENKLRSKNVNMRIVNNVFRNLKLHMIFKNFEAHILELDILENHKYELIKLIILEYLKVKLGYEGKTLSLEEHDTFIRHTCTKTVLFKGQ